MSPDQLAHASTKHYTPLDGASLTTMELDELAKLQKEIADLKENLAWQYEQLEQRDGITIPGLEEKIKNLEASCSSLRNDNTSLRRESSRFETALAGEKTKFQNEVDDHEQSKTSLRSMQQKYKAEEARAKRAESKVDEMRKELEDAELESDKAEAMKLSLHQMIDELQAECDRAHQEIEIHDDAVLRLRDIEDTFEPIFQELGIQLTPQNLVERFTMMHNKSQQRPKDSDWRPGMNGRNPSTTSISDELSFVEEDDAESDEGSPIAPFRVPNVNGPRQNGLNSRNGGSSENGGFASNKDRRSSNNSQSAADNASPGPDDHVRGPQDVDVDAVPAGVETLSKPESVNGGLAEAESPKVLPGADGGVLQTASSAQSSLPQTTANVEEIRRKTEARFSAELATREKLIRELRSQLNSRPPPQTITKTIHTYLTVPRDGTFLELLERTPWWMKVVLMIMAIAYAGVYISAWRERKLWLAANDTTYLYGRRLQSTSNQCHWAVVEWFENYIGLDKGQFG